MKPRPDMEQIPDDRDWPRIEAGLRQAFGALALITLALTFIGAVLLWWLI